MTCFNSFLSWLIAPQKFSLWPIVLLYVSRFSKCLVCLWDTVVTESCGTHLMTNWSLNADKITSNIQPTMRQEGEKTVILLLSGCTLVLLKISEEIEINIISIFDRIAQYQLKWLEHFNQMDGCCIPKQLMSREQIFRC